MKNRSEAAALAKHISAFLGDYVPSQKSGSANTLKAVSYTHLDVYKRQGTYYSRGDDNEAGRAEIHKRTGGCLLYTSYPGTCQSINDHGFIFPRTPDNQGGGNGADSKSVLRAGKLALFIPTLYPHNGKST